MVSLSVYTFWFLDWWDRNQLLSLLIRKKVINYNQLYSQFIFWWQLLYLVLGLVLCYSLTQLINYTLFALVQINWFNFSIQLAPIVIMFCLYLSYWFVLAVRPHPWAHLLFTITGLNVLYGVILHNFIKLKPFHWIHFSLTMASVLNILAYKTNFILWTITSHNTVTLLSGCSLLINNVYFTCDALFFDHFVQYNSTQTELNLWVTSFNFNVPTVNQLLLVFSNLGCYSLYQLTSNLVSLVTIIVVPYVHLLGFFSFTTLTLLKVWQVRLSRRF
jgi:hypothetical protein